MSRGHPILVQRTSFPSLGSILRRRRSLLDILFLDPPGQGTRAPRFELNTPIFDSTGLHLNPKERPRLFDNDIVPFVIPERYENGKSAADEFEEYRSFTPLALRRWMDTPAHGRESLRHG